MIFKAFAVRGAVALALAATATAAWAQSAQAPAAPPMPALTYGAPIGGVCVVSFSDVVGSSTVGKAVADRLQMLAGQVDAELRPQATALATEQKALQASANPDAARVQAFEVKANAFQKLRDQRMQEMEATQQKQVRRIILEAQPVVAQVFQQKQCSILLQRDAGVVAVNPAMDLTTSVIVGLNQKITTLTFDRETVTAEQAGGAQ
jgi:outer membrane protein